MKSKPKKLIRIIFHVVISLALTLTAMVFLHERNRTPLFGLRLHDDDRAEIARSLDFMKIKYEISPKGQILVRHHERFEILLILASRGLPRKVTGSIKITGKGRRFSRDDEIDRGESDARKLVKMIDGVDDALIWVFPSPLKKKTLNAAVVIKLKSGAGLSRLQVETVVNAVSSLAPGLSRNNVRVFDISGKILNNDEVKGPETIAGVDEKPLARIHAINRILEKHFEDEIQAHVGRFAGPRSVQTNVNFIVRDVTDFGKNWKGKGRRYAIPVVKGVRVYATNGGKWADDMVLRLCRFVNKSFYAVNYHKGSYLYAGPKIVYWKTGAPKKKMIAKLTKPPFYHRWAYRAQMALMGLFPPGSKKRTPLPGLYLKRCYPVTVDAYVEVVYYRVSGDFIKSVKPKFLKSAPVTPIERLRLGNHLENRYLGRGCRDRMVVRFGRSSKSLGGSKK